MTPKDIIASALREKAPWLGTNVEFELAYLADQALREAGVLRFDIRPALTDIAVLDEEAKETGLKPAGLGARTKARLILELLESGDAVAVNLGDREDVDIQIQGPKGQLLVNCEAGGSARCFAAFRSPEGEPAPDQPDLPPAA